MWPVFQGVFTNAYDGPDRARERSGIVNRMFDVLVYLYENYWRPDACPATPQLSRKLSAAGFESEEIEEALQWLDGLSDRAEHAPMAAQQATSRRVYTADERECLGDSSLSFIGFLESAGVLSPQLREVVVERAMAAERAPIDIEDLKVIVLMVFWSLGEEPDALILDELFVDDADRLIH